MFLMQFLLFQFFVKLSYSGLSLGYTNWFHSYLTNRHASICIHGTLSSSYTINSGVPQGSTLGPLFVNASNT
jgi:hypothetical protein